LPLRHANKTILIIQLPPYTKIEYTGSTVLSEARTGLSAAAAGNKIVYGGGNIVGGYSKTVDINDVSTNIWTTNQLIEARAYFSAAAAGNKILFAGGIGSSGRSKTVDIFILSK
jgi:hypothetical protein